MAPKRSSMLFVLASGVCFGIKATSVIAPELAATTCRQYWVSIP
jgi:hypothetical protein